MVKSSRRLLNGQKWFRPFLAVDGVQVDAEEGGDVGRQNVQSSSVDL